MIADGSTADRDLNILNVDSATPQFLTRAQLLAHADLYNKIGFPDQFLWYAKVETVSISSASQIWSDCHPATPRDTSVAGTDACEFANVRQGNAKTVLGDFTGAPVALTGLAWPLPPSGSSDWGSSNWIALACGNWDVPLVMTPNTGIPVPIPTISGTSYNDANRDGLQEAGEGGVAGITYKLIRVTSFVSQMTGVIAQTTSAADGSFSFALDKQGPGVYQVEEVVPQAGWAPTTKTLSAPLTFDFNNGNRSQSVSFGLYPPITAQPVPISGVEGESFSGAVAAFTDSDPLGPASEYGATINWGDGSATSAGAITQGANNVYTVSGTHTYPEEGAYSAQVTVTDNGIAGSSAVADPPATVGDAPLTAAGETILSTNPVDQTVATFTDANPGGTTADFTATIDWGDGTQPTTGVVTGPNGGPFTVSGSHSYASLGPETIRIHILDDGGSTADATTQVTVYGLSSGGDFVIGDQGSAIGTQVTFWGSQWAKDNILSGGSAPASFKGFENDPGSGTTFTSWSTDPGNSSGPPSSVPSYMAVIVAGTITESGPLISGDAPHVVIVRTDPGYSDDPGHPGTGTVVATLR